MSSSRKKYTPEYRQEAARLASIGMVSPVDFEAQLADQNGNKKAAA
ncbi:hypothetical protein NLL38_12095 [Corynebacterium accolens]|nr:hypothetical protein [Corynebacterium accolens]WKS69061.1 hypothetical protein NLL40_12075 [Corynebacterium accolens]WKS71350.1 hypothetical protein NLL38_12095 [Corynebacterium accolens]